MAEREDVDETVIELGKLAQKTLLGKNRDKLLSAIAEDNPDMNIPEINARKAVEAATAPLQKKIDEMEKQRVSEQVLAKREKMLAPLRKRGYDDTKIAALEKFMADKGVHNYEIAAKLMDDDAAAAAPRQGKSFSTPQMPSDELAGVQGAPSLYKQPRQHSRTLAHQLIDAHLSGKPI